MRLPWVRGSVVAAVVALAPGPVLAVDLGSRDVDLGSRDVDLGSREVALGSHEDVDVVLGRAVQASRELPHAGRLTIVSFGEQGPQVSEIDLTRGEAGLRVQRDGGWELGRVGDAGYLLSSDTLLRVGGVERLPAQLDRLRAKYLVAMDRPVTLDTGPAIPIRLTERDGGIRREVLYVDEETGLIVRRETFDRVGGPVRLVAYTSLDVGPRTLTLPAAVGLSVVDHRLAPGEVAVLRAAGYELPARLPAGFELLAALEVDDARIPTLHAVYGDGLYTLSVFQQRGRMARTAVRGASELITAGGGAVWRWPGSEPRRIVWSGAGATFTVLTDAPTDEALDAIAGLPTDPPPSTLDRLARGLTRVGRWFWPTDRSEL